MRGKNFTASEIEYIKHHYKRDSIQDIAKSLGRSAGSVSIKIYKLRMSGQIESSDYKSYTQSELEYITKNYGRFKTRDIADKLGRTTKAIELTIVRLREKEYQQNTDL